MVLDEFLSSLYTQSAADPCVYTKIETKDDKRVVMIIVVYVDDTILVSNDMKLKEIELVTEV